MNAELEEERNVKAFHRKIVSAALLLLSAFSIQHSGLLFGQAKTTVTDTIYNADGSKPSGTLVATNLSTFTSADNFVIAAGSKVTAAITNGLFSISLVPNAGSNPSGTSYAVNYYLPGLANTETWVVPSSVPPVNLAAVRVLSPPLPTVMLAMGQINPPSPCTANFFAQWSGIQWQCAAGGGGGGATFQVNGANTSSQTTINWQSGTNLTVSNPSAGNVAFNFSGTLPIASGGTGLGTLTAHDLYVGNGTSSPNAVATGNVGQVLISNGASADPTFQDPIVSYAYVNLFNAASATATATSSTVRVPTFGGFGTLYTTYASITGSPSGCAIQIKNADSLGNLINNGSAISTTPANGTTTAAVNSGANLQTTAQIEAVYSCSTYPTAGTISLDYVPGIGVGLLAPLPAGSNTIGAISNTGFNVNNTPAVTQSGTWTVQPGNTQNTTAWLTQDAANGTVAAGAAAGKSELVGCQFNTTLPTLTNTQQAAAQCDSSARLLVGSIAGALPTGSNTIGAVTQASGPWTSNVTQFGGTNLSTGTGAGGAGIPRVTISNDSSLAANQSVNLAQVAGTNTLTGGVAGSLGFGGLQADGSAFSGNPSAIAGKGSGAAGVGVARIPIVCDNWKPFSFSSTTAQLLVTGVASKQTYICSINIVVGAATNVALIEGTTTTNPCDTGTAGMAGGTTAATGWNFAANGGLTQGTGVGAPFRTVTAADNVCVLQSAATQVSGNVSWTQF